MKKITVPTTARAFHAWLHFQQSNKNILFCCYDEMQAIEAYQVLKFFAGEHSESILLFPGLETVPYDRVDSSNQVLAARANVLTILANNEGGKSLLVVTASRNLIERITPVSLFRDATVEIKVGDKISITTISSWLIAKGYMRVATAHSSSEFAVKGEIIDIVCTNDKAYRVNLNADHIESIKEYDTDTQISTDNTMDSIMITPRREIIINDNLIKIFKRKFLHLFGVNHIKDKIYSTLVAEAIADDQIAKNQHEIDNINISLLLPGYEYLRPLFYEEMALLADYMNSFDIMYDNLCMQAMVEYQRSYQDFYAARTKDNQLNLETFYLLIPPEYLIAEPDFIKKKLLYSKDAILTEPGANIDLQDMFEVIHQMSIADQQTSASKIIGLLTKYKDKVAIFCGRQPSIEKVKMILSSCGRRVQEVNNLLSLRHDALNLASIPLNTSFVTRDYLFITEKDIFTGKLNNTLHSSLLPKTSVKKLNNILIELGSITPGELVVHKEHGIGKFEQVQTIVVHEIPHDCLKILYANNDVLYLPVENINQLKKLGNNDAELDKLGKLHWQQRKAKLKNRIKDIAAKLIKISAQRHMVKSAPIHFEQEAYDNFCQEFPYDETDDQIAAINDIRHDMESGKLMDRLICGDVGFGKTEVAMRAAFMVACGADDYDQQIAIIAPTTILCQQHYKNFLERFKAIKVKIVHVSRLVKPAELKRVKAEIMSGEARIIVGTHAVFSSNVQFKNLRLLIIDEEQHFGVSQKEHIKQLKDNNIHVLSLSATPIPRTLQMAIVGIRDLSIIATPPVDRLPVKTHLLPFDSVIIRDALMREHMRGGLSFIVAPRIKDIEVLAPKLEQLVPELKYKIVHGQMPPATIDKIMNEFYTGQVDILLSTTIIESGIDVPNSNTIIIYKAEMLGLSQLYQLRGRVGRGQVLGYAYLVLGMKKPSAHSLHRLEILQNIVSLGAGFTIASHDMDIRGFGNLIGDEQSGHIKEVGAELYHEMLSEAISELQHKSTLHQFIPNIRLNVPVLIPAEYIKDAALRLTIYRRVGTLQQDEEVEKFILEMIDRFGPIPSEFGNLLEIVKLRNQCLHLGIENIDVGTSGFLIKFNEKCDVMDMVMSLINKYPRHVKFKSNNQIVFMQSLDQSQLVKEVHCLLGKIAEHKT